MDHPYDTSSSSTPPAAATTSFADAFNRVAKLQRPTKLRREHNKTLQLSDEQQRLSRAASDRCVLANTRSQWGEALMLLPYLLRAATWRPGSFVEIGALDGVLFSNTYLLEKCFGWSGLLIEANSQNYARLQTSGRSASKVHSAVCKEQAGGFVNFTRSGVNVAAQLNTMSKLFRKRHGNANKPAEHELVPCRPLSTLMADAGLRGGANFLSLDVEGAEEVVLQTVDPICFDVVLVEMDGTNPARDRRVHDRLEAAGLAYQRNLGTHNSGVYLRPKRMRWRLRRLPKRARGRRSTTAQRCGEVIHPEGEYEWNGKVYSGTRLAAEWRFLGGWWAEQQQSSVSATAAKDSWADSWRRARAG